VGSAPSGFPTVTVECAFASAPGALSPTYTDITDYVLSFQTRRGRSDELQPYSAGTASIVLNNQDGRFDPTNASSPYSPNVLPMKLLRIRSVWSATTYYQFTGFVDAWSPSWPTNKQDVLTVTATDAFKVLTQTRYANAADTPEPMETIATRVGKILTVASVGASYQVSTTRVASEQIDSDALSLLQALEQTEGGSMFIDEQGLLRFEDRHYRANNKLTVQATFGDGDTSELPYTELTPVFDETQVINDASITASKAVNALDTPAVYQDSASIIAYLDRSVTKDLLFYDANQCADYAWYLVQRFKTPMLRFDSLAFEPATFSTTGWPQALGRVIGDLIRVIRRTPGGNTIDQQVHIDSIAHSFDAASLQWTTTWGLSPKASAVSGWRLDDAVNGLWGTTTVLSS
jgi:hypothetical protein